MKPPAANPNTPVVDLHQDLLPYMRSGPEEEAEIKQTSWRQLEESPIRLVVASTFAMGLPPVSDIATSASEDYMGEYVSYCAARSEWQVVLSQDDVPACIAAEGPRGVLIHVEGVGRYEGDIEDLFQRWFELGCRSVGIVWNEPNGLAYGPGQENAGLTSMGARTLRWLDTQPVAVDLAHMSRASFRDAMNVTDDIVIVSHANARKICDHPRNLDDDQLRAVQSRAGVVGVVFSSAFVGGGSDSGAGDVVRHIDHIASVAGIESVAIGSDLGGVLRDRMPALGDVGRIGRLLDALAESGYSQREVEMIAWRNAARALTESLA